MNDFKIWKMVWDVRYPATSMLFDNRGKIASKWQWTSDLSEWRISNNQVTIHNKANTTSLTAGYRNSSVVMELPKNTSEFNSIAADFSAYVFDTLQPKKIERMGFRIIQVAKRAHFKLVASKIRENIFGLSEADWQIFGGPPVDIAFPLTLAFGEDKASFTLGPMKVEQLSDYFEADEVKKSLPKVALFMDFDFYNDTLEAYPSDSLKSFSDFLNTGTRQIKEISDKLMDRYGAFQ
jgi:hypothetical protein